MYIFGTIIKNRKQLCLMSINSISNEMQFFKSKYTTLLLIFLDDNHKEFPYHGHVLKDFKHTLLNLIMEGIGCSKYLHFVTMN